MPPAGRAGPRTASPLPTHAPGLPELPPQLLTGHCVPRHAVRTATQGRAPRLEPLLGSVPLTRRSPRPGRRIWLSHFISAVGLPVLSGPGGSEKPPAAPARLWPPQHADEPAAKRTGRPQALSYMSVLGLNWQVALRGGALRGAGGLGDSITRAPLSPAQGGALPCSRCRPAHTPRPPQLLFQVLLPSTSQHALTDPPSVLRSHTIPAPLSRPARTRVSVKLS